MKALMLLIIALTIAGVALGAQGWTARQVYIKSVTIHALAVTSNNSGAVINITVTAITPGTGNIYVATSPLPIGEGGSFIASSQMAAIMAASMADIPFTKYDFLVNSSSNTLEIGGPSASGYMTVGIFSLLDNRTLNSSVTMTGMIMPDGTIGPVGGIPDKIRAAASMGYKVVLVPYGQQIYTSPTSAPVNLISLGKELGVTVIPVSTVYQAAHYLTGISLPPNQTLTLPPYYISMTKYLYETLLFNKSIIPTGTLETAEYYANQDNYYTAASLIYSSLINYYQSSFSSLTSSQIRSEAKSINSTINNYLALLNKTSVTSVNIDVMVGMYDRIYQAQQLLNQTMSDLNAGSVGEAAANLSAAYVRVATLKYWYELLKGISGGYPIPNQLLYKISQDYLSYAQSTVTYLYSLTQAEGISALFAGEINQLLNEVSNAQTYFGEGNYLMALSNSLDVISETSTMLHLIFMSSQSASYETGLLSTVRQLALYSASKLEQCNATPLLPLSYIQYGDYWYGQYNSTATNSTGGASSYFSTALNLYEMSSAYSNVVLQLIKTVAACNVTYTISVPAINETLSTSAPSIPPTSTQSTIYTTINPLTFTVGMLMVLAALAIIIKFSK
ncbi:S16 family serine protease [Thermocladium modestius]|nr:S16 family serine protease [Thermocladium modestius]